MGASTIGLFIGGDATRQRVMEVIDAQRNEDAYENGHQHGYSGDWQTISTIRFYFDLVFDTQNDAWDYAIDHSEKYEAMAVKWFDRDGKVQTGVFGWAAE